MKTKPCNTLESSLDFHRKNLCTGLRTLVSISEYSIALRILHNKRPQGYLNVTAKYFLLLAIVYLSTVNTSSNISCFLVCKKNCKYLFY